MFYVKAVKRFTHTPFSICQYVRLIIILCPVLLASYKEKQRLPSTHLAHFIKNSLEIVYTWHPFRFIFRTRVTVWLKISWAKSLLCQVYILLTVNYFCSRRHEHADSAGGSDAAPHRRRFDEGDDHEELRGHPATSHRYLEYPRHQPGWNIYFQF